MKKFFKTLLMITLTASLLLSTNTIFAETDADNSNLKYYHMTNSQLTPINEDFELYNQKRGVELESTLESQTGDLISVKIDNIKYLFKADSIQFNPQKSNSSKKLGLARVKSIANGQTNSQTITTVDNSLNYNLFVKKTTNEFGAKASIPIFKKLFALNFEGNLANEFTTKTFNSKQVIKEDTTTDVYSIPTNNDFIDCNSADTYKFSKINYYTVSGEAFTYDTNLYTTNPSEGITSSYPTHVTYLLKKIDNDYGSEEMVECYTREELFQMLQASNEAINNNSGSMGGSYGPQITYKWLGYRLFDGKEILFSDPHYSQFEPYNYNGLYEIYDPSYINTEVYILDYANNLSIVIPFCLKGSGFTSYNEYDNLAFTNDGNKTVFDNVLKYHNELSKKKYINEDNVHFIPIEFDYEKTEDYSVNVPWKINQGMNLEYFTSMSDVSLVQPGLSTTINFNNRDFICEVISSDLVSTECTDNEINASTLFSIPKGQEKIINQKISTITTDKQSSIRSKRVSFGTGISNNSIIPKDDGKLKGFAEDMFKFISTGFKFDLNYRYSREKTSESGHETTYSQSEEIKNTYKVPDIFANDSNCMGMHIKSGVDTFNYHVVVKAKEVIDGKATNNVILVEYDTALQCVKIFADPYDKNFN